MHEHGQLMQQIVWAHCLHNHLHIAVMGGKVRFVHAGHCVTLYAEDVVSISVVAKFARQRSNPNLPHAYVTLTSYS